MGGGEDSNAEQARIERELQEMSVPDLLSMWEHRIPEMTRAVLRTELDKRHVRFDEAAAGIHGPDPVSAGQPTDPATRVAKAIRWILIIGVIQIVFSPFAAMVASDELDAAERELAGLGADEVIEVDGSDYTVAELRENLRKGRIQLFVVPFVIGLVFLGLYAWARSSPLPAMISAIVLFVAVHAISAVADPMMFLKGCIVAILFLVALVRGLRQVLAAQAEIDENRAADEAAPTA